MCLLDDPHHRKRRRFCYGGGEEVWSSVVDGTRSVGALLRVKTNRLDDDGEMMCSRWTARYVRVVVVNGVVVISDDSDGERDIYGSVRFCLFVVVCRKGRACKG